MGQRNVTPEIIEAAEHESAIHNLPPGLLLAFCTVESGGDQYAWNPEPHYRYLVDAVTRRPFRRLTAQENSSNIPPVDFPSCPGLADDRDAEFWGQKASWGVMQVMGAVAREYGFSRHFPAMSNPAVGIRYGAIHLAKLMRWEGSFGLDGVIAAYNAGSPRLGNDGKLVNQSYVDKINGAWER